MRATRPGARRAPAPAPRPRRRSWRHCCWRRRCCWGPRAAAPAAPLGRAAGALTRSPAPSSTPAASDAPPTAPTTPAATPAARTATPGGSARPSAAPSPAARGAPAALDPCRLATKQEVEAAAGFAHGEGQPRRSAVDVCLYEEPPGRGVLPGRVYLYALRGAAARAFYDDARAQDSRAVDVPGVGDRAFLGAAGEVTAQRGGVFVQLAVENGLAGQDAAAARARRLALVRAILERQ